jgi:hypothetical protein
MESFAAFPVVDTLEGGSGGTFTNVLQKGNPKNTSPRRCQKNSVGATLAGVWKFPISPY